MLFIPGKRNEDKKGIIPFLRPRYTKDAQRNKILYGNKLP